MKDNSAVVNYMEYLKTLGLNVTLHPMEYEGVIGTGDLVRYNIHDNPYCLYLKAKPELWQHCVCTQKRVFNKAKKGAFCGICHAGVLEYVCPITDGEKTIGFISVSGYRCDEGLSRVKRTAKKYGVDLNAAGNLYSELSADFDKEYIKTLVTPLAEMLELRYKSMPAPLPKGKNGYEKILHYINVNHTSEITVADICEKFFCSPSYVSHIFKKNNGTNISDYVNDLRVRDAAELLKYSDLEITEVSAAVGFRDANYFSAVFRKKTGLTPKDYRKEANSVQEKMEI